MFIIIIFNKKYQESSCKGKGDFCLFYIFAHCHDEAGQKCEENYKQKKNICSTENSSYHLNRSYVFGQSGQGFRRAGVSFQKGNIIF